MHTLAPTTQPGTTVMLDEPGIPLMLGRFTRFCDNGWEAEVEHDYDGGGFDFWPIEFLRLPIAGEFPLDPHRAGTPTPFGGPS